MQLPNTQPTLLQRGEEIGGGEWKRNRRGEKEKQEDKDKKEERKEEEEEEKQVRYMYITSISVMKYSVKSMWELCYREA